MLLNYDQCKAISIFFFGRASTHLFYKIIIRYFQSYASLNDVLLGNNSPVSQKRGGKFPPLFCDFFVIWKLFWINFYSCFNFGNFWASVLFIYLSSLYENDVIKSFQRWNKMTFHICTCSDSSPRMLPYWSRIKYHSKRRLWLFNCVALLYVLLIITSIFDQISATTILNNLRACVVNPFKFLKIISVASMCSFLWTVLSVRPTTSLLPI